MPERSVTRPVGRTRPAASAGGRRSTRTRSCGVCGEVAAETALITAIGVTVLKDLCLEHLHELLRGSRRSR